MRIAINYSNSSHIRCGTIRGRGIILSFCLVFFHLLSLLFCFYCCFISPLLRLVLHSASDVITALWISCTTILLSYNTPSERVSDMFLEPETLMFVRRYTNLEYLSLVIIYNLKNKKGKWNCKLFLQNLVCTKISNHKQPHLTRV